MSVDITRSGDNTDELNNSELAIGQIEILLRMGREQDPVPADLLKLSEVLLADGKIDQVEAKALFSWLMNFNKDSENWITKILLWRIRDMLADGVIDEEERAEIFFLLSTLHGETRESTSEEMSSNLPFCDPPPEIIFEDRSFCLTGQFAYGPRSICHKAIEELGGKIEKRVNWRVDYLVIGTLCTRAWANQTYGRKIEEAILIKGRGNKKIHIVSEDHWARSAFKM
jgi:NAD-dependent DNA ligase